jgi:hypothetical protein
MNKAGRVTDPPAAAEGRLSSLKQPRFYVRQSPKALTAQTGVLVQSQPASGG